MEPVFSATVEHPYMDHDSPFFPSVRISPNYPERLNELLLELCLPHPSFGRTRLDFMEQLLRMGANVECHDAADQTPLHRCVLAGQIPQASILLKYGALTTFSQGKIWISAFSKAIELEAYEMASLLLQYDVPEIQEILQLNCQNCYERNRNISEILLTAGKLCRDADTVNCYEALRHNIVECLSAEYQLSSLVDPVQDDLTTLYDHYRRSREAVKFLMRIGTPLIHHSEVQLAADLHSFCTLASAFIYAVQFQSLRNLHAIRRLFGDVLIGNMSSSGLAILQRVLLRASRAWDKTDVRTKLLDNIMKKNSLPLTLRYRCMALLFRSLGRCSVCLWEAVETVNLPPAIKRKLNFSDLEDCTERVMLDRYSTRSRGMAK